MYTIYLVSLVAQLVKKKKKILLQCIWVWDLGLIPGSGWSPGEGNGSHVQCSCLVKSMDRGAGWVTVHGVAKSWTWLIEHGHTHVAALELSQQNWVAATENAWSAMPKIFTIWNFTKSFVGSCCVQYFEITATTLIAGEYCNFYYWQKSQLLQILL